MIAGNDNFDWSEEDPVVQEQLATTIYRNDRGELVIRQKADAYDEGDTIVLLTMANAPALAHAILDLVAERLPLSATAPKDKTAAERQRRRRDKQRDATVTVTVENRDTGSEDEFEEVPPLLLAAE
jgi:hypothetical protein